MVLGLVWGTIGLLSDCGQVELERACDFTLWEDNDFESFRNVLFIVLKALY